MCYNKHLNKKLKYAPIQAKFSKNDVTQMGKIVYNCEVCGGNLDVSGYLGYNVQITRHGLLLRINF